MYILKTLESEVHSKIRQLLKAKIDNFSKVYSTNKEVTQWGILISI